MSQTHPPWLRSSTTTPRSHSLFPFFMLVAFEGGSPLRALLLLCFSTPLLLCFGPCSEFAYRAMVLITFCGMRVRDAETVARAVLPRFFLQDLHLHVYGYQSLASEHKTVISLLPRPMAEWFFKEYIAADVLVATELQLLHGGRYFTGLITSFPRIPTEVYNAKRKRESGGAVTPKPLVFHDGRLAFLPTAASMVALYMWLPLGILLAVLRLLIGLLLPYKIATIVGEFTGFKLRVSGLPEKESRIGGDDEGGVMYVCTHRTLLDPVILTTALRRKVPAVTYSLSWMSEAIAPMRTVRLTRDKARDGETMRRMLGDGDLIVCPEGTTCREPYLLRFSSLFAEVAGVMAPVAVDARGSMFYGTTATGMKWLDPFFFLMNPAPEYWLGFLGRVKPEDIAGAGGGAQQVANEIQRRLAEALEFQCTNLTRRDKYRMLARNEGRE